MEMRIRIDQAVAIRPVQTPMAMPCGEALYYVVRVCKYPECCKVDDGLAPTTQMTLDPGVGEYMYQAVTPVAKRNVRAHHMWWVWGGVLSDLGEVSIRTYPARILTYPDVVRLFLSGYAYPDVS